MDSEKVVIRRVEMSRDFVQIWFMKSPPDTESCDLFLDRADFMAYFDKVEMTLITHVMNHGMVGLQLTISLGIDGWKVLSIDGMAHPREWPERVLCASVELEGDNRPFRISTLRHNNAIALLSRFMPETWKTARLEGSYTQGFLTSKGRFVTREEALWMAKDCGQADLPSMPTILPHRLFSEDLY